MKKQSLIKVFGLSTFALLSISCSEQTKASLSSLGSSILGAAGVNVSPSQIGNAIAAGETINSASRGLTDEQEYYLGRAVSASILQRFPPVRADQANRYVNKVGRVLAAYSPRPETFNGYRFAIVDSAEVNALSAPGGFVFVSKGFVRKLDDEDSLAAVLAHEVAHVALGHGTAAISQAHITSALALLGKDAVSYSGNSIAQQLVGPLGDSVSEVVETLLTKGYSRSQEYEADLLAAQILSKAGYQQAGLLKVLKTLESNASVGGWFETHPKPDDRIDELTDEVDIAPLNPAAAGYSARKARFLKLAKVG